MGQISVLGLESESVSSNIAIFHLWNEWMVSVLCLLSNFHLIGCVVSHLFQPSTMFLSMVRFFLPCILSSIWATLCSSISSACSSVSQMQPSRVPFSGGLSRLICQILCKIAIHLWEHFFYLEDISPFYVATDTPILDFWKCIHWVSKPEWVASFMLGRDLCLRSSRRFTSGAIRIENFHFKINI